MQSLKLPQVYSQFDPRWAKLLIGFNTDPKYDFYNFACLLSEQCDVLEYFGIHVTPDQWNDALKQHSGFVNGGEYVDGSLARIYPQIKEKIVACPDPLTDAQLQEMRDALDAGCPVMLGVDYNPKTLAVDYHFVLAIAYNPNDENDFTIADSLGGRVHSLKDYLGATKPSARITIQKYFIYSAAEPVAKPADAVKLQDAKPAATPTSQAGALPANYGSIVHGSSQWDEVVKTYRPDVSPESIDFPAVKEKIDSQVKTVTVEKEVIKEVPVEKIVEKPIEVAASTPDHAASEWDQTVAYLELGKSPQDAGFEDVKRVIAGIKSRQTDFERQAKAAQTDSAKKDTIITNANEEISKLEKDMLNRDKLNKVQIDSLKQSTPNFDKLVRQYEAIVKDKDTDLKAKIAELKQLRIDLTVQNVEGAVAVAKQVSQSVWNKPINFAPVDSFLSFIKRVITIKW